MIFLINNCLHIGVHWRNNLAVNVARPHIQQIRVESLIHSFSSGYRKHHLLHHGYPCQFHASLKIICYFTLHCAFQSPYVNPIDPSQVKVTELWMTSMTSRPSDPVWVAAPGKGSMYAITQGSLEVIHYCVYLPRLSITKTRVLFVCLCRNLVNPDWSLVWTTTCSCYDDQTMDLHVLPWPDCGFFPR